MHDFIVSTISAICLLVSNIPYSALIAEVPVKEILINAIGSLLGGALLLWFALGWNGIKALRSNSTRPLVRIEVRRAPENIFTGIELGSTAAWVQQQLGHPTKAGERWWGYRFSDALERDRYFFVQAGFVMTLIGNEQEVLSKRYQS